MSTTVTARPAPTASATHFAKSAYVVAIEYGKRWHETPFEGTELQAIETARAVFGRSGLRVVVKGADRQTIANFGPTAPETELR